MDLHIHWVMLRSSMECHCSDQHVYKFHWLELHLNGRPRHADMLVNHQALIL